MSTFYTPPSETAYLVSTPFYMPSKRGDMWAVAFPTSSAQLLNSKRCHCHRSIGFWGLIAAVALYCAPRSIPPHLAAGLTTLRNATDPWAAFKGLLAFAYASRSAGSFGTRLSIRAVGFVFSILALAIFVASITLGILAPSLLQIGNMAPVRPGALYFPSLDDDNVSYRDALPFCSPWIMRALSAVEIAKSTLRSTVQIETREFLVPTDENTNEPGLELSYSYSLTGPDFGLSHANGLALNVAGACRTEYSWLDRTYWNDQYDVYHKWGNTTFAAGWAFNLNETMIKTLPKTWVVEHPETKQQLLQDGNWSFVITTDTAHHMSYTAGTDPWYVTELRPTGSTIRLEDNPPFWVKSGRPVLVCWEQDEWGYEGVAAKNIRELKSLPGIRVPEVLLEVFQSALSRPQIGLVTNYASGPSLSLASTSSSPGNAIIDAGTAGIKQDMERLILISFVATQNTLIEATLSDAPRLRSGLKNVIVGSDGQPREGAGAFALYTTDVQTFSLPGLIGLGAVTATLLILKTLLMFKLRAHSSETGETPGTPGLPTSPVSIRKTSSRWSRFSVFSAANLFDYIYRNEVSRGISLLDSPAKNDSSDQIHAMSTERLLKNDLDITTTEDIIYEG
ncbi:hypothetical protein B0H67DRAFT_520971 [Lasiosphaeris hirsuta]|uniref:Transmembrane protein n=1 Tax=Lasiosphaeris hirsuta TaxID=260670 RepID=A0AA40A3A3_9PEZI|nr:hypothetical protein B0H67DRAFT_520971 [Lasiosphaeris hirsuta]